MLVIAGDETGLVKLVDVDKKKYVSYGTQTRRRGITSIHWVKYGEEACVCRVDGTVEIWNLSEDDSGAGGLEILHEMSLKPEEAAAASVRGVGCCGRNQICANSLFFTEEGDIMVRGTHPEATSGGNFKVSTPLGAVCASATRAVFGGRENDLDLWDLQRGESVWRAKNVPHDEVRLRVPVWIAGVAYFGAESDADGYSDVIVTGTGHRHIRLYDVRVQRQPVISISTENEFRITRVSAANDGQRVFVADTVGGLQAWDVRKQRLVRSVRGFAGSIRDIQQTSSGDVLVAGGLDRYIRAVDISTGNILQAVYLRNRVNAACICGDNAHGSGTEGEGEDGEGTHDDDDSNVSDILEAGGFSDDDDDDDDDYDDDDDTED